MNYILVRTIAILVASYITHVGVPISLNINTALVALSVAFVLAIINHTIKPIIDAMAFPITVMTLGAFSFVINGAMIVLASYIVSGFIIPSYMMAIYFSIVLTGVNWLLHAFE